MKSVLRRIGAFVAVAVLGFLGGFILQWTKVSEAKEARTSCEDTLGKQSKSMELQASLLSLYRARHEAGRNNFGLVGDHVQQARDRMSTAGVTGDASANAERAAALAAATDAAAIEPLQNSIAA